MEAGGLLCALSWASCRLVQGWGGGCPGHRCVYESMIIPPPGLSLCKKGGEILPREATGEIKGKNVRILGLREKSMM